MSGFAYVKGVPHHVVQSRKYSGAPRCTMANKTVQRAWNPWGIMHGHDVFMRKNMRKDMLLHAHAHMLSPQVGACHAVAPHLCR